jgi:transcriptional regulator GlxA family with amidase domain
MISCPALGWEAAARHLACEDGGVITKAGVVAPRDVALKVVCVYPSKA